jgi:hypothetical protein
MYNVTICDETINFNFNSKYYQKRKLFEIVLSRKQENKYEKKQKSKKKKKLELLTFFHLCDILICWTRRFVYFLSPDLQ